MSTSNRDILPPVPSYQPPFPRRNTPSHNWSDPILNKENPRRNLIGNQQQPPTNIKNVPDDGHDPCLDTYPCPQAIEFGQKWVNTRPHRVRAPRQRVVNNHLVPQPQRPTVRDHGVQPPQRPTVQDHKVPQPQRPTVRDHGVQQPQRPTVQDHKVPQPQRPIVQDHGVQQPQKPEAIIRLPQQVIPDWQSAFNNGLLTSIRNPLNGDVYYINRFLGKGAFGAVFKAEKDGQSFAIKVIYLDSPDAKKSFVEEAAGYTYLSKAPQCQTYIVCLYDQFTFDFVNGTKISKAGVLVTELMDGDLKHLPVQDNEILSLIKSTLEGLDYIHSHDFAHQDIKPENILRKGALFKFGDLGLICSKNRSDILGCSSSVGTPLYMSPYKIKSIGKPFTLEDEQKEDIWSLGLTLYEIIFKTLPPPFKNATIITDIANITQEQMDNALSVPYPRQSTDILPIQYIITLLTNMLQVNPVERWDVKTLLNYFNMAIQSQMSSHLINMTKPLSKPSHLNLRPIRGAADGLISSYDPIIAELQAQDLCKFINEAFMYLWEGNDSMFNKYMDYIENSYIDPQYLEDCYQNYLQDYEIRKRIYPNNVYYLEDILDYMESRLI